jgi:ParB/RepB/Spo0J family partition protein
MADTQEQFIYIPVSSIVIQSQVRSPIDPNSESQKTLQASIEQNGILEPPIVTQFEEEDGKYLLICGERRVLAARSLGIEFIWVRFLDSITQKAEIIALRLTENQQREELDHISLAIGIRDYMVAKHADRGYDLPGVRKLYPYC